MAMEGRCSQVLRNAQTGTGYKTPECGMGWISLREFSDNQTKASFGCESSNQFRVEFGPPHASLLIFDQMGYRIQTECKKLGSCQLANYKRNK